MSDFEDQILRDRLQRLGGRMPDDDVAYAALQHRVRVAKRRRAAIGSSGLAALCVVALVVANLPGRTHQSVTTATNGVTVPDASDPVSSSDPGDETTTSAAPTTTAVASTTSTQPDTTTPATQPPDAAPTLPAATPAAPGGAPSTGGTSGTSGSKGGPASAAPTHTSSPAPTAPPAPSVPETEPENTVDTAPSSNIETRTFSAAHGSLTVRLANGRLTIIDEHAEDGYDYRVDRSDPDRIRVRFRSDQATSQIDVSINGDHIVGSIEEQSSGVSGIAPSTSTSTSTSDSTPDGAGHT